MLARPGKQAPVQDSNCIECGTCHMVIYRPDNGFDAEAFRAAREKHYSAFPACEIRK
jgi:ferredoxin-like protein FixX